MGSRNYRGRWHLMLIIHPYSSPFTNLPLFVRAIHKDVLQCRVEHLLVLRTVMWIPPMKVKEGFLFCFFPPSSPPPEVISTCATVCNIWNLEWEHLSLITFLKLLGLMLLFDLYNLVSPSAYGKHLIRTIIIQVLPSFWRGEVGWLSAAQEAFGVSCGSCI